VVLRAPIQPDWTAIQHQLARPVPYTVIARILGEQRGRRTMSRCPGMVGFTWSSKWIDHKSMVDAVKVGFSGEDNKPLEIGKVHPVELAEVLYVMRLLVEAS
jgi:hypothetical protein